MSLDPTITRRGLLVAGAGTASIAVLAACSSSSNPSSDKTAGTDAAGTQPATQSSGGSSSAAGGSSSAASTSGGSADTALATLADVPIGGAVSVKLPNGKPGIVARPTSSTAKCFSAICTHEGCTVKPEGKTLNCPCHMSVFNSATGAVESGPAPSPLPSVSVKVVDGKVVPA